MRILIHHDSRGFTADDLDRTGAPRIGTGPSMWAAVYDFFRRTDRVSVEISEEAHKKEISLREATCENCKRNEESREFHFRQYMDLDIEFSQLAYALYEMFDSGQLDAHPTSDQAPEYILKRVTGWRPKKERLRSLILGLVDTGSCPELVIGDILNPDQCASKIERIDTTKEEIEATVEAMISEGKLRRVQHEDMRGTMLYLGE